MKIRILGNKETEAFKRAERLVRSLAHVTEFSGVPDLAIAPLLTEILSVDKLHEP